MNRSMILTLVLLGWVLAGCSGSSSSVEDAHDDHDEGGHDGHHHDEPMYTELQDWLDMRATFDSMPEPPDNMMVSVEVPVSARWSGDIEGTMNPSHPEYSHPEISLYLDEEATMHGNVTVESSTTNERERVLHLDAYNVTGPRFESPDDHENRMTGTFYGDDQGTVVGTVNTQIVIGTYQADKTESTP